MATHLSIIDSNGPATCWRLDRRGCFALRDDQECLVTPRGRKARAIVAYLGTHPGEHVSRDRLIELLWADRGEAQARGSLRQSLLEIRRAAHGLISSDHSHVWIECAHLEDQHWDQCSKDEQLFDDLDGITPEFDDWLRCERAGVAAEEWSELQRKVQGRLSRGEGASAMPLVERMRAIDPYNEDWLRLAMRAESQAGHPAGIQRRFRDLDDLLKRELGVSLSAQTRALHDELLSGLSAKPPEASAPAAETLVAVGVAADRAWARLRPWPAIGAGVAMLAALGLTQSGQSAGAEPPRIAVLPFAASAGVDAALAEGLSDELHSQLARNERIRVIGRTSAAQFKGRPTDLRDVGRKLDARYIVEGTVHQKGDRISIFVSLVNARDGTALWSRNFAGASRRLAALEAAIDGEIGRSLGGGTLPTRPSTNGEAYALYLRAKGLLRNRDAGSAGKALELLRQANRIDPGSAAIWAQLAAASHFSWQADIELSGGARISKREAAARALKLDPNLAEAHAMAWLVESAISPTRARAHLRQALKLNPNDSQALFWWGNAASDAGDFRRAAAVYRRAAEMDPLWKRPVTAAIQASLGAGDRARALNYLRMIKTGNPEGAKEVEVHMAIAESDYSRAVQLAFGSGRQPWDVGKASAALALIGLGFEREALLVCPCDNAVERAVHEGHPPPLPAILHAVRNAGEGDFFIYTGAIPALARQKRWSDIAALYDANLGLMRHIRGSDRAQRQARIGFGPIIALSLHKAGREAEAVRLLLASDADARMILANGEVPPTVLVEIAGNEAVLGRRDESLSHLEKAFAMGWRMDELLPASSRIRELPVFATLRGDPRFERLRRIQAAHIAKERREIQALGIF